MQPCCGLLGITSEQIRQNMVGWLIGIEQNAIGISATLASYDHHRWELGGIPAFSFLLAFPKDTDGAILLLRLVGSTALRQDMVKETLVQHYQSIPAPHAVAQTTPIQSPANENEAAGKESGDDQTDNPNVALEDLLNNGLDAHTHSFLSFGGYICQVLGSLYTTLENGQPKATFGADIEYLPAACIYTVSMPTCEVLAGIIKTVKQSKAAPNQNMMQSIGFNQDEKPSFKVGELRYSATRNLQHNKSVEMPSVCYNFDELIAQRTAVFGMTRTGKSNMIKNLISQLHIGAANHNVHLGQLIFDINGEYANINNQDQGSLAHAFGKHAVRFAQGASARKLEGVFELLPDFYSDLQLGLTLIQKTIREKGGASSESFTSFMAMQFSGNHGDDEGLSYMRKYLYRTLLWVCGYKYNDIKGFAKFDASKVAQENKSGFVISKLDALCNKHNATLALPTSFEQAVKWLNRWIDLDSSQNNQMYFDLHPELSALINLIRRKSGVDQGGRSITGIGYISMCVNQHCPNDDCNEQLKGEELLTHIRKGRLVIIDLSGSSPSSQIMLMRELADRIFGDYIFSFTNPDASAPKNPPCLIYIEEAHNMLGKNVSIDDVWPRIAKEGSKYGLGLVYATQEPSSVQTNILSNTENMIVCHLNNTREVKEIANFFDFDVFSNSIIRLQEPGFVRLKQRDMPFVIPVQVEKFDVNKVDSRIQDIDKRCPHFMLESAPVRGALRDAPSEAERKQDAPPVTQNRAVDPPPILSSEKPPNRFARRPHKSTDV